MHPRKPDPEPSARLGLALLLAATIPCVGCEQLVPRDDVTGRGTINLSSEKDDIRRGEKFTGSLRAQCEDKGIPFDQAGEQLDLVQSLGRSLAGVSHRPDLPWEFHFLDTIDVNAFAVPGGKVFVLAGLFGNLVTTREELAAVLAHELAHVTARHGSEQRSRELLSPLVSKSSGSSLYKATFNTRQEDEADRIGLLYMALAGFDPAAAPKIWRRAHARYGSDPGNYLYDHSLHADRARKVEALVPMARRYFKGAGVVNEEWKSVLARNDLIDRSNTTDEFGAVLEALADAYLEHLETKSEAKSREAAARKKAVAELVTITNLRFGRTSGGKAGVFVSVRNGSNVGIRQITLTIHYLDSAGTSLYSESIQAGPIRPGKTINPGFLRKSVRGSDRVNVVGADLDID